MSHAFVMCLSIITLSCAISSKNNLLYHHSHPLLRAFLELSLSLCLQLNSTRNRITGHSTEGVHNPYSKLLPNISSYPAVYPTVKYRTRLVNNTLFS